MKKVKFTLLLLTLLMLHICYAGHEKSVIGYGLKVCTIEEEPAPITPNNERFNLAVGRATRQSSTEHGGASSRAVDGNTNGAWEANSVTHTTRSHNPWLEIDIGSSQRIKEIKIYNRTDECCSDRLKNIFIVFSNEFDMLDPFRELASPLAAKAEGFRTFNVPIHAPATSPSILQIEENTSARFIRIWMDGFGVLSLAEVEIFEHIGPPVDIEIDSDQNLALMGTASQISTAHGGDAERAIDGNKNGIFGQRSVTHTASNIEHPWWQVDLKSQQSINDICIYNRTDECCSERLKNIFVVISKSDDPISPFGSVDSPNGARLAGHDVFEIEVNSDPVSPSVVQLPGGTTGRFVRIWMEGSGTLSLAEVEIKKPGALSNEDTRLPPLLTPPPGERLSTISLLIVYNDFVKFELDSFYKVTPEDWMDEVITEANEIYQRSGVWQKLEVANLHFEPMSDIENAEWTMGLLNDFQFGEKSNLMTDLRRRHQADIVIFWSKRGGVSPGARGIGVPAKHAFVNIPQGGMDGRTLVHELGHLQGASHQEGRVHPIVPDRQGYRTVMNSQDCANVAVDISNRKESVPILSNPDIHYRGQATGVAGVWNTAKIFNETRERIAGFSDRLDRIGSDQSRAQLVTSEITSVSIGDDMSKYATDEDHQLWRWKTFDWIPVSTPVGAKKVTGASDTHVWFIGEDDFPYQKSSAGWVVENSLQINDIAVGSDGTIFVVDQDNQILKWNGDRFILTNRVSQSTNSVMQGQKIACSSISNTWAIGMSGNLWKWNDFSNQWEQKNTTGTFKEISLLSNGDLWLINSDNKLIYSSNGVSNFRPLAASDDIRIIATAADHLVWKLNSENKIQKLVNFDVGSDFVDDDCSWRDVRWHSRFGRFDF